VVVELELGQSSALQTFSMLDTCGESLLLTRGPCPKVYRSSFCPTFILTEIGMIRLSTHRLRLWWTRSRILAEHHAPEKTEES
jgi:hypothetical protein